MALDLAAPHPDESIVDQQDKRRAATSWYRFFLLLASTLNSLSRSLTSTISDLGAVDVLTARGDLLTRNATANARLPIGAAGTLLSSDGTDASWQPPSVANIALQLLASGDASGATLDLDLSSYTAYRGIVVELYAFVPVTDGVDLTCQFSTDGGANWLATTYRHGVVANNEAGFVTPTGATGATSIVVTCSTANARVGNVSTEGVNATLKLMGWQLSSIRPRIMFDGVYLSNAATAAVTRFVGGGQHDTAQDVTALRLAFSSGNIASGKYAVYGLT